ncbi:hypothetical protein [Agriterribacter humi]|uniref:hypothetical protein n=1 Tax=Agriterribacter humi TaxID=1104781 RepID=UPI001264050E|nr:hypothetical protein [Agriterribacter humi]
MASLVEVLLVLSVFTKEIGSRRIFGIDFDFIAYPFAIVFFLFHLKDIVLAETFPWKIYLYLIIISLFSILLLQLSYGGFLKQFLPILIIYSINFFIIGTYNWRMLFRLYLKFTWLSAIFGIIQVIVSYGGIDLINRQAGRLDSIAYEPSHYAAILVPALVFAFFHFKQYKLYFFTMLAALLLTYNLTGYLAFLAVISIAYINPLYVMISVPLLYYLVFHVLVNFNENFNIRITETQQVFSGDVNVLTRQTVANGTTVSLYSNLMVAEENLKNGNIFGSGLGGHEEMYYRYFENSSFRYSWFYGLNAPSGHSLTIRIFSEFGLTGLIIYFVTLIRKVVLLDNGLYRSISLACLSHFVCKSFKLGGYIDYGTPFFFAMLLINYRHYHKYTTKAQLKNERKKPVLPVPLQPVA